MVSSFCRWRNWGMEGFNNLLLVRVSVWQPGYESRQTGSTVILLPSMHVRELLMVSTSYTALKSAALVFALWRNTNVFISNSKGWPLCHLPDMASKPLLPQAPSSEHAQLCQHHHSLTTVIQNPACGLIQLKNCEVITFHDLNIILIFKEVTLH